ncbi:YdeI/OmpD-associated family protein [Deinococcus apachensis]|uniref:YdeI/OmpD-associated family protein n=1 Tax=Deinococcus apachensis TaxID=309886 RepID=UPI00035C4EAD|nr:YdeI/OmpD-associated family protein [Deinococcus apachensis]
MTLPPDAFEPESRTDWRAWLEIHHDTEKGVWLVLRKKSADPVNLSGDEAVEEALCFGWIDSKPRKLDEARSMLYIAPRKPGSGWSAVNKARIERMQEAGLMTPAGQAKIDAAIRDGSWGLLDGVDALEVPPDLEAALTAESGAKAQWDAFPRSAKRGILEWIAQAKTAATREKRVRETATLAARGERANQWRRGTR